MESYLKNTVVDWVFSVRLKSWTNSVIQVLKSEEL